MKIKQKYIYLVKLRKEVSKISKTRPCLVVQNNVLNKVLDTVIVIPLSSKIGERPGYQILIQKPFLQNKSHILTNMITTVHKSVFTRKLGKINGLEFLWVKNCLQEIID